MKKFLRSMLLGTFLLASVAQAQGQNVGRVTEVEGTVQIVRSTGQLMQARMGNDIQVGDVISTGPTSKAKIWFRDESVITLAEKSKFKVDALDYQPGVRRRSMFTLVSGKARALVSGWFSSAPEEQYQIRALSTVAGVRGSGVDSEVQGQGPNAAARFAGWSGTITLWNASNPGVKISLPPNFFVQVPNGQMPGMPQPMPQQLFEQFNQGFAITTGSGSGLGAGAGAGSGSSETRNEQLFQQIIVSLPALPAAETTETELPGNLSQNLGSPNQNYLNPAELIFQEPPGFTFLNIRLHLP